MCCHGHRRSSDRMVTFPLNVVSVSKPIFFFYGLRSECITPHGLQPLLSQCFVTALKRRLLIEISAMASAAVWSKENLFVQLVAQRLQHSQDGVGKMQNGSVEPWDSPPQHFSFGNMDADSDSSGWDAAGLPAPVTSCACGARLKKLEDKFDFLQQVILSRLPSGPAAPLSPLSPLSPRSALQSPHSSQASSNASSPLRFQFACPLCLKPQLTPKSHCEHVRNAAGDGVHHCRFIPEHHRHARILQLWGSGAAFVKW